MILGIFLILLACLINSGLVLFPGLIAAACAAILIGFLRVVKMRWELFEEFLRTVCSIASLFFAASLQVYIWALSPGEEGLRWTLAQLTFVLGTGVVFIFHVGMSDTPSQRSWRSWRFLLGVIILSATLAAAYSNIDVYQFVKATPGQVFKFVFGEVKSKEPAHP